MEDKVLEFINRRFSIDCNWTSGNCYYFAKILQTRFPQGKIFYDVIDGHFLFEYEDNLYDYNGKEENNNRFLVDWDKFEEYDSLQKKRIIEDCIK